jgi:DNA sulfur modification protein DndB
MTPSAYAPYLLFQQILGYGRKSESKDKQTKWLQQVNEMRNVVAHASSGISLSVEQVNTLDGYEQWLKQKTVSDSDEELDQAPQDEGDE